MCIFLRSFGFRQYESMICVPGIRGPSQEAPSNQWRHSIPEDFKDSSSSSSTGSTGSRRRLSSPLVARCTVGSARVGGLSVKRGIGPLLTRRAERAGEPCSHPSRDAVIERDAGDGRDRLC